MSRVYEDYLQYLEDLAGTLDRMTEVTKAKDKAARTGDLVVVESLMKKEQVFSMTLRGMDIKRDKMLSEMGLQGVPLSKLAENYPPELFDRARKTVEHLQNRYAVFNSASEAARVTMECALHEIERMLPENQPVPAKKDKGEPPVKMKTDFRA